MWLRDMGRRDNGRVKSRARASPSSRQRAGHLAPSRSRHVGLAEVNARMLTTEQITDLARCQAQFLSYALGKAKKALLVTPSIRCDNDASTLVTALDTHLMAAERAYEAEFARLGGFIDVRMGQSPVDLLTEWVRNTNERGRSFHVLGQWAMAQRLRSRLMIEMAGTPVPLAAIARFCVAIREEARRCVQQSRGESACILAEEVEAFSELIESYQERMASSHAKRS